MKKKILEFYAEQGLHIPKLIHRRPRGTTPEQIEQAAETYYKKLQGGYKPAKNLLIAHEIGELAKGIDATRYVKDKELLAQTKESFIRYKPLLVTIAAGVEINLFTKVLKGVRVIRCMPNLAAVVGESISFIAGSRNCKKSDISLVKRLFSSIGEVVVIKESMLDKATAISGSGPGYVFNFMDGLYKSAVKLGFSKADAREIVVQTFLGSIALAYTSSDSFEKLVKKVASKKGTTEAALEVFKKNKQEKVIDQAVKAAYKQASQLARKYRRK